MCKNIYKYKTDTARKKIYTPVIYNFFPKVVLRAARSGVCPSQSRVSNVKTAGSSRNSAASENALVAFSSTRVEAFACVGILIVFVFFVCEKWYNYL